VVLVYRAYGGDPFLYAPYGLGRHGGRRGGDVGEAQVTVRAAEDAAIF